MTTKNKKKEAAKKKRNLWPINPVTRVVENKKAYDRHRDRKSNKLYEESEFYIKEGTEEN